MKKLIMLALVLLAPTVNAALLDCSKHKAQIQKVEDIRIELVAEKQMVIELQAMYNQGEIVLWSELAKSKGRVRALGFKLGQASIELRRFYLQCGSPQ